MNFDGMIKGFSVPIWILFMNFSMNEHNGLAIGNDKSTNITFEAIVDLQILDRLIIIDWMRELCIRFQQGFVLESIENGFPFMYFQAMKAFEQMTFEVLFNVAHLTAGTNGDLMLRIVLNK